MATRHNNARGAHAAAGAMTMAMQAARAAEGPKVLRIGVIEGSRILEERVLRTRESVTVGTTERNAFVVNAEGMPAQFELFTLAGAQYRLNFTDAMEGRVALATGVHTLAELRATGRAQRTHAGWQLPLSDSARGKVVLGSVALLFQFVQPPPAQVRPQLPVAIRSRPGRNMDWNFNASVAFFMLAAFGAVSYVEYGYDPIVEDDFAVLSAPSITALIQPSIPETPPPAPPPAPGAEAPTPPEPAPPSNTATGPRNAPNTPHGPRNPSTGPRTPAQTEQDQIDRALAAADRATRAAEGAVAQATFGLIAASNDPSRSAVARVEHEGLMGGSAAALNNVGGIVNAHGNDRPASHSNMVASVDPSQIGHGHLAPPSGNNIASAQVGPEVGPRTGTVRLSVPEDPSPDGRLSNDLIGATIRRNIGGIQNCYTMALRNRPTLRGRLEATFTIGTSGRVTGSPSTSGLTEAPEVGQCVATRLRYIVFPQPQDGAVETTIPFNFAPGG